MTEQAPDGWLLSEQDLEDVTEEEIDELEEIVNEYVELVDEFDDDLDEVMQKMNNTDAYEKLGVELNVEVSYQFSIEEKE